MHDLDVSRETIERLKAFEKLFLRWNARINLVSKSSLADFWNRHIADSLQLARLFPGARHWVDLGSGGGFPAIVVAIAKCDSGQTARFTLIESDTRKAAFLRTVVRELNLPADVINDRIEIAPPCGAEVVSARALADLDVLLAYAERHMKPDGVAAFQKGARWQDEVEKARLNWRFDLEVHPSKTDKQATVLEIRNLKRV